MAVRSGLGQLLTQIAGHFKVGKTTLRSIIKAARTAVQAPAPTTATKPAKASRNAAAAA